MSLDAILASIDGLERQLAESRISLEVTDAARAFIAREGYDPQYGARPLRRAIQRLVENPLAKRLLGGEFSAGDGVLIDEHEGSLVFEKVTGAAEPAEPARASV